MAVASLMEKQQEVIEGLLGTKTIIERALALFGLDLRQSPPPYWLSSPIETRDLKNGFLETLLAAGFRLIRRNDGITTLSDSNPQSPPPGFSSSSYWSFGGEDKLTLTLSVTAEISQHDRGVVIGPHVMGPSVSAADDLPRLRVFQAVVRFDVDAHRLIREITESNGRKVIGWGEIQFGGIRNLGTLFEEFTRGKPIVKELARFPLAVFSPNPLKLFGGTETDLYLPEPLQSVLLEVWRQQLSTFKAKI